MIALAIIGGLVLAVVKYRRFRLTGQALRADRQPVTPWTGRYARSPYRRAPWDR